jgi:ACS family hexuronate transporter-like MFS transporter
VRDPARAPTPVPKPGAGGRYRWLIVWLLFGAVVINYVDRQILGVLKPYIEDELGWSETDYADIVFWFQASYALSFVFFGRLVDRIGAKWGYSLAFVIWTLAHIAHAGAYSIGGFIAARVGLGIGEAGNFPAGIKAITEWFPQRERAFATGLFNAGSNIGALVTPILVPAITLAMGWRAAFVITGIGSLFWLVAWLLIYKRPQDHPRVSPAELAYIEQDPADVGAPIPWRRLILYKETWAIALAKFLIDPIWWMFLFWLPDFFAKTYHLDLKSFGPPLVAVYLLADIGSIFGGWFSSRLITRGISVNVARKSAMLFMAVFAVPVMFAQQFEHLWLAVLVIGLAAACHQGVTANVYTLASDLFPRRAIGSVIGIGGTIGAIGGMIMAKYVGYVLERIGSYTPLFILAGSAYLAATLVVHILSPRLTPVRLDA